MLRTMRSNASGLLHPRPFSFVAWLAIGQVMSILGPAAIVVLRVNRKEYPVAE